MNILGINAYHGDVSAVLVRNGELVAAVEEERFRRIKHWAGFPSASMKECLEIGKITPREIDHFAISRNPRANFWRKVLFGILRRPRSSLVLDRVRNTNRVQDIARTIAQSLSLDTETVRNRIHWIEHHPAHLASAFFVSPFDEAAVCALDGFGDFVSTSFASGEGSKLEVKGRVFFPHSVGLLYLAVTQYLGFMNYGDEYKVMGLAPYGQPDFVKELGRLIRLKPKGRFELDLSFFRHWSEGVQMTWDDGAPTMGPVYAEKLETLLGPARRREDPLEPRHEAVAASLQVIFEEVAFHVLNGLFEITRSTKLCFAGGCAMNSVANGKIRRNTPFKEIFIQPAAGDNGTALGAAFYVWNQILGGERRFVMEHALWGPEFGNSAIRSALKEREDGLSAGRCEVRRFEREDELLGWTAQRISDGLVVGWYQGPMEWGARALGNRSILAHPGREDMRDIINTKIKFREKFRPFAPSVLEEAVNDYFVEAVPDPFMIQVYPVRPEKRNVLPAVTHVDGSGRMQTVHRATNPRYWKLIKAFEGLTGVPVLLNTSFNENEPIVHRPEEALDCFLRTQMDVLVMGDYVVTKEELQNHAGEKH